MVGLRGWGSGVRGRGAFHVPSAALEAGRRGRRVMSGWESSHGAWPGRELPAVGAARGLLEVLGWARGPVAGSTR